LLLEQLEFFAEEELIQIVPSCSVPGAYIDGILVRGLPPPVDAPGRHSTAR
jgi:hypothetical protein